MMLLLLLDGVIVEPLTIFALESSPSSFPPLPSLSFLSFGLSYFLDLLLDRWVCVAGGFAVRLFEFWGQVCHSKKLLRQSSTSSFSIDRNRWSDGKAYIGATSEVSEGDELLSSLSSAIGGKESS